MAPVRYYSIRMRAAKRGAHISGAEGIYERNLILQIIKQYSERALQHEKGRADEIRLTIEELRERPKRIAALPLCTVKTRNPVAAKKAATRILTAAGISERAVEEAYKSLNLGISMRGAMLIDVDGVRLEPDLLRGVRVSRMGITKLAMADLSKKLLRIRLNNSTVKEALILASKVHRYRLILGELCISDDPSYTTGYVSTRAHGYVRLPHIKKKGLPFGGRAFFIAGGEVKELIHYLQHTPVIISSIKPCSGPLLLKEILERKPRH